MPQAIEEGLRWEPPLLGIMRTATRDTEVEGVPIPAGSIVVGQHRLREPRRAVLGQPRGVRHLPPAAPAPRVRVGPAHVPRPAPRPHGDARRAHPGARPAARTCASTPTPSRRSSPARSSARRTRCPSSGTDDADATYTDADVRYAGGGCNAPRRPGPRQRRRSRRRAARPLRGPPAGEARRRRAEARAQGQRHRRVAVHGRRAPEHRAQRGRGPSARGVRDGPAVVRRHADGLLRHPRPRQGHERQRHARLDVLPVVPAVLRPAVRPRRAEGRGARDRARAGVQRLAHRELVRRVSRPLHPARRSR